MHKLGRYLKARSDGRSNACVCGKRMRHTDVGGKLEKFLFHEKKITQLAASDKKIRS